MTIRNWKGRTSHQIAGLAMGSQCSATIASLYLATVEKSLLYQYTRDSAGRMRVLVYSRYIDYISLIYKGPEQSLERFLAIADREFAPLSVKWKISGFRLVFLDTDIHLKRDVITSPHLETKLYRKPRNRQMNIPWSTAHPISVKRSFVKAELARYAIICSEELRF